MIEALVGHLVKHPIKIVIATVLVVFACSLGGQNIELNADYRAFFGPDNPQLRGFEDLQDQYNKVDNIYIAISPKDGQVFTHEVLALIEEITQQAWLQPYVNRVDSLSNFQYTHSQEDDLIVEPFLEDVLQLSHAQIADKKIIALNDPVLAGNLVSFDGRAAGINLTIGLPGLDQAQEVPYVVEKIRKMLSKFEQAYPDINFYLTGVTMLNNAFPEASVEDITFLYPLMILVVLLMLFLSLKGMWGTIATFSIVIFSCLIAIGLFGWPGVTVTALTLCAPIMIMTLAIADCIHILMSYYQSTAKGMNKQQAMIESIRVNFQPVLLTSVTTAIGFLSLNFSDSPPFHDLGNIVCLGVLAAFALAVFFLPALMMLLPNKNTQSNFSHNPKMALISGFVIKHYLRLLGVMSALVIFLLALIPLNELDDNVMEYFDHSIKFRVDSEKVVEELTGIQSINYSLNGDGEMSVAAPSYLATIDAFAVFLRSQPEVRHVNSFSDVMKRLNKNMNNDQKEFYKLPSSRELAAQFILLYELSLPYGLDINNQVNRDKSASRMIVQLDKVSSSQIINLDKRAVNWLKLNAPEHMLSHGVSANVMFAHITTRNIKSMMSGVVSALFLISLIIMVTIKSVRLGLISLIPNLIPTGMGFGLWAIFDGQVGLSLSVVMGVTLGIVVDDTIHFLSKYIRAKREMALDSKAAIEYAFQTVGVALTSTTMVLCVGFLVLTLSPFSLNSELGLMSAITIALALLVDFFLLPPLLLLLDKPEKTITLCDDEDAQNRLAA